MPILTILRKTRLSQLVILFLIVSVSLGFGQTPRELQERMRERLPQIDGLKREQLVGENRKGFLEPLKPLASHQQELVRVENADRERIYEALAAQSRASPAQVGAIRARQIAERSARGIMIQDDLGRWVEKGAS